MTTQPFEQAVSVARDVLAGVSADQLGLETPCASWDVAAVINHIVAGHHRRDSAWVVMRFWVTCRSATSSLLLR